MVLAAHDRAAACRLLGVPAAPPPSRCRRGGLRVLDREPGPQLGGLPQGRSRETCRLWAVRLFTPVRVPPAWTKRLVQTVPSATSAISFGSLTNRSTAWPISRSRTVTTAVSPG